MSSFEGENNRNPLDPFITDQTNQRNVQTIQREETNKVKKYDIDTLNWIDNYFLKYSYTYNISLKMFEKGVVESPGIPSDSETHFIVAQSGKSASFYIKSLSFSSVNVLEPQLSMEMEIEEPNGFSFIDKYIMARALLHGKEDSPQIPLVLEISFRGYDSDGKPMPQDIKKTWKVFITDIKTDFRKSATVYNLILNTVPQDMVSQEKKRHHSLTSNLITLKKEGTLQSIMKDLSSKLSDDFSKQSDVENKILQKFTFDIQIMDDSLKNVKVSTTSTEDVSTGNTTNLKGEKEFKFEAGSDVSKIIQTILNNIKDIGLIIPNISPSDKQTLSNTFLNVPHIEKSFELLEKITDNTYHVKQIYRIYLRKESSINTDVLNRKQYGFDRVKEMNDLKICNKKYEYLFTGKNTEIIDLTIDYSNYFVNAINAFNNIRPNPENQAFNSRTKEEFRNTPNPKNIITSDDAKKQYDGKKGKEEKPEEKKIKPGTLMETLKSNLDPSIFTSNFQNLVNSYDRDCVIKNASKGSGLNNNPEELRNFSILSSIFNSLSSYATPGLSAMVVDMTITGDPFWIGFTPLEYDMDVKTKDTNINGTDFLNLRNGVHNIFLTFKYPSEYKNDTGIPDMDNKSIFNGIYWINQIQNVFENGKFIQKLNGAMNITVRPNFQDNTIENIELSSDNMNEQSEIPIKKPSSEEIQNNNRVSLIIRETENTTVSGSVNQPSSGEVNISPEDSFSRATGNNSFLNRLNKTGLE